MHAHDVFVKQQALLNQLPMQDVLDSSSAGITVLDAKGTVVYCNAAQCALDESNAAYLQGKNIWGLYPPESAVFPLVKQVLGSGEKVVDSTIIYHTPKKSICQALYTVLPITDADGGVVGIFCSARRLGQIVPLDEEGAGADQPEGQPDAPVRLVGRHQELLRAIEFARTAAQSPSPILLCGETGTGKEVFARCIHAWSPFRKRPYVTVNCAAIPPSLAESILFGTAKGSFTGAAESPGLFEQANGGILFLDEVDSMPLELQPKLLRVIQEMRVRRVGAAVEKDIAVKIVAAAGSTLQKLLQSQRLRLDLYYRLGVNVIELPPLRERLSDLQELVNHFIVRLNYKLGQHFRGITPEVMDIFKHYHWPGNVRELEHALEASMNAGAGLNWLTKDMLPPHLLVELRRKDLIRGGISEREWTETTSERELRNVPDSFGKNAQAESFIEQKNVNLSEIQEIKDFSEESEKQLVKAALQKTYGNITLAAQELGISRQLLHYKMKKFHLSRLDGRK